MQWNNANEKKCNFNYAKIMQMMHSCIILHYLQNNASPTLLMSLGWLEGGREGGRERGGERGREGERERGRERERERETAQAERHRERQRNRAAAGGSPYIPHEPEEEAGHASHQGSIGGIEAEEGPGVENRIPAHLLQPCMFDFVHR